MDNNNTITRFAPSPTGLLHIGVARTGLFSFLYARQNGGKFILRIEDTDKERSKEEYEQDIYTGLEWLGLTHDETYRQSERADTHKKYLEKMLTEGSAYEAEENEAGTGKVIRFKNSNKEITFTDIIRGDVTFDTTELGDFVIAKNTETPLYHLAVVVDDHEDSISHVIRGEDHISNTPRQILIGEAIGALRPTYAHIPLILDPKGGKLSKRRGAASLAEYKEQGYLPEAVANFLALLGWHPKGEQEIFTIDELIREFELADVQKGGAVFDKDKLDWVNRRHIENLPSEEIEMAIETRLAGVTSYPPSPEGFGGAGELRDKKKLKKLVPVMLERINKWGDIDEMVGAGELSYFFEAPEYDAENLVWKDADKAETREHLEKLQKLLSEADFESVDKIKEAVWDYAEEKGKGGVLWPLRYALSGRDKSPDPFTLCYVLGKNETLARLEVASEKF